MLGHVGLTRALERVSRMGGNGPQFWDGMTWPEDSSEGTVGQGGVLYIIHIELEMLVMK
jgi:hypothetical protein